MIFIKPNQTLQFYNDNFEKFVSDTVNVNFSETQNIFTSFLSPGSSILDFGCGSGRDTKLFIDRGYSVTAVDGSEKMCRIASEYSGIKVKKMLFNEFSDVNEYDGIWACASILHVNKSELPDVFSRMIRALKANGIIYTSFKYGTFEGLRGDRYYTDFNEDEFKSFLKQFPQLKSERLWITEDVRPERREEKWLNIILRKVIIN